VRVVKLTSLTQQTHFVPLSGTSGIISLMPGNLPQAAPTLGLANIVHI
jgi:hypothetical protein